ncbi:MAG: class 1 fructose-bisphosphatase [Acidobacteriota bacterium]
MLSSPVALGPFLAGKKIDPGLRAVLEGVAEAGRRISARVNRAGLDDITGGTGDTNVQGEAVQKLDVLANDIMVDCLAATGEVAVMGSEEVADPIRAGTAPEGTGFAVLFDPLDGSSNIDVAAPIGTIFSVHRPPAGGPSDDLTALLRPGRDQAAAGYVIYGSSTLMVFSTGGGVDGFTLNPRNDTFILSHPAVRFPPRASIYSINDSNLARWDPDVVAWVNDLRSPPVDSGRTYTARYIGSLVADFHRNLLRGGVFAYPADRDHPLGKLRLLYEAAPLAFLACQAGGGASHGTGPIEDITPTALHQRTPLFIGNLAEVERAEAFHRPS